MERVKGYLKLDTDINPLREEYHEYVEEAEGETFATLDYLGELKRINIFVGANNSGKSRLMCALFAYQHYNLFPTKEDILLRNCFKTSLSLF